jgi:hypothetical protein
MTSEQWDEFRTNPDSYSVVQTRELIIDTDVNTIVPQLIRCVQHAKQLIHRSMSTELYLTHREPEFIFIVSKAIMSIKLGAWKPELMEVVNRLVAWSIYTEYPESLKDYGNDTFQVTDPNFFLYARCLFPVDYRYLLHLLAYEYRMIGSCDKDYAKCVLNSIPDVMSREDLPSELVGMI